MDRIDLISFIAVSYSIAWLTDMSGTALVASQVFWLVGLWISKRLIDRWIDRKSA